jgi:hypothetical protein
MAQSGIIKDVSYSERDSLITHLISQISSDSIKNYMLKLESFYTRHTLAPNRNEVVNWIIDKFRSFGFSEVTTDSFLYNGVWCRNIIASLPSSFTKDGVLIAGAHYDSYSQPIFPGADDNASGTAAVLEMARVSIQSGFKPLNTIRFITFAAEEQGLLGSSDLAGKYKDSYQKVSLMVNLDMIASSTDSAKLAYIHSYSGYEAYQIMASDISEKYAGVKTLMNFDPGKSDSYSFYLQGYPALYFEESESYYRYHSPNDSVSYCNSAYASYVTKAAYATLLYNSFLPTGIKSLILTNLGDGENIRLRWKGNTDPDLMSYKVLIGRSSMCYDSLFTTLDTTVTISGLKEDSLYYFAVCAVNKSNMESVVVESTLIPSSIPYTPRNLLDAPQMKDMIVLNWLRNTEEDLYGYNIYRSADTSKGFTKINSYALKDTLYLDKDLLDTTYFYFITAIDNKGNESKRSSIVKSHAVTMSHGILIVDDSKEIGMNFKDAQIDSFYISLLSGRKYGSYDLAAQKDIKLSDLGQYSTIIWHKEISPKSIKNLDALKKYLDFGGNFLFSGFKITDFKPDYLDPLSVDYTESDFIYKYLKVKHIESSGTSTFIGAVPEVSNFKPVTVEMDKTKWGHLEAVETMQPAPGGSVIFRFDSKNNSDPLIGKPVGIEYIGSDYKVVMLSFPLFFIKYDEASELLSYILSSKFNQETAVNDKAPRLIKDYCLYQNYPNPFNPETIIKYDIPAYSFVELKVYDVLGRTVSVLYSGYRQPGTYETKFDGSNFSSGTYILTLRSDNYLASKKLIILK